MPHPRMRDDMSQFLVHLTRDYGDRSALENLVSILRQRKIEARNPHCLFAPKLKHTKFSPLLRSRFNTVCLTETPLHQISKLLQDVSGRQIKLQPYGMVFKRTDLQQKSASPAIYINSYGTSLRDYLLAEFDKTFSDTTRYRDLKEDNQYPNEIIRYYALVNVMCSRYDFSWEREWRMCGDLRFRYEDIVAIIADESDEFEETYSDRLSSARSDCISRIPVIKPSWSYEEIIMKMSEAVRQARS